MRPSAPPASSREHSASNACWTSSPPSSTWIRSSSGAVTTPTPTGSTPGRSPRRSSPSAIAARSRTGNAATRCARRARGRGSTAWGWRARSGTAGARGPYASISAGSSTVPSMGPAVRSAAADAKRQLLEIAGQRFELEERVLDIEDGRIVSSDGGSWPLEEITGLLEDGHVLGKGARGPNPTGMRVLTFGVQVAEVAVDIETGEVRVE